ncbi:MAG TPA: aminopeptidase P N-terminal domain-containing protein [Vicinamibacterales bacterium]|jgi:Xaa-Pro aminopeptidase|nr:aminopeptidase P N-terminal domain-containing protein [Vicinamibacterales bacterium]
MKRRLLSSLLIVAALAVLPSAAPARAGELQDDLAARRAAIMRQLAPDDVLVLWSAPERVFSRDVNYEFRQDSNFYYLTAIDQPDSILVLMPGVRERNAILFISPSDPTREHWNGHLLTAAEATTQSGITSILATTAFASFMDSVLAQPRARLMVLGPAPGLDGEVSQEYRFANKARERFLGLTVGDAANILAAARQIKTAYERKLLQESADISSEAHKAGMKATHPGAWEYEVEAAIEYVFKKNGDFDWGYPSIVGSGPNATTLHYEKSTRQMKDGELLLVDAAGLYKYMTVDITRTYPVNGHFTKAQRDIYEIVLQAQEEGMQVAKPGSRLADIHAKTVEVIKQGLLKLGLITDATGDQYRTWYTHSSSHWIGIDVHDVGDNRRPLEPGMAFTIEPGIYIRESALDNLPKTPANEAFIARVRPVVQKYKDIGVRIEDSFLLTETGLTRLSAAVPRTVDEIEAFMKAR